MSPLSCLGESWGCQRQAGDAHERQPWAIGCCGLRGIAIPIVPAWEGGPLRRLGFACREEIDDALARMNPCMLMPHGGEDFGFVPRRITEHGNGMDLPGTVRATAMPPRHTA